MYFTENTLHTPLQNQRDRSMKRKIKDVFTQHSLQARASRLKVPENTFSETSPPALYKDIFLTVTGSMGGRFAAFGLRRRKEDMKETGLTQKPTQYHTIYCICFHPKSLNSQPAQVISPGVVHFLVLHSYTDLCGCLHSCWTGHSFSFCVCTARY